jgi:hypothetical protein
MVNPKPYGKRKSSSKSPADNIKKKETNSSLLSSPLIVIFGLLVIGSAVFFQIRRNPPDTSENFGQDIETFVEPDVEPAVGSILKEDLNQEEFPLKQLMKQRVPRVFRNTKVENWLARKWNFESLFQKYGNLPSTLKVYKRSVDSVFGPNWRTNKPLSALNLHWNYEYKTEQVSRSDFFKHLKQKESKEFWYYQDDLDVFTGDVYDDLGEGLSEMISTPKKSSMGIWMGQKGVTAHAHYDSYDNVYVQIQGRKKFRLVSPTKWREVQPYPFLHPSFAQSQRGLGARKNITDETFFTEIEGLEVVLFPGDVLYIPPSWWHEVTALDNSLSINFWSYARENDLLEGAWTAFVGPAEHFLDQFEERIGNSGLQKLLMPRVLYSLLIDKINDPAITLSIAGDVIKTLFEPSFVSGELPEDFDAQRVEWCKRSDVMHQKTRQRLDMLADDIALVFRRMPKDTRSMMFANFLEFLGYWSSDAAHSGAFIKHCIA